MLACPQIDGLGHLRWRSTILKMMLQHRQQYSTEAYFDELQALNKLIRDILTDS